MSTTEQKAARWYAVDIDGAATLCVDQADAEQVAKTAQAAWPHLGPHRAVQLVEAPLMGAAGDAGSEPVAIYHGRCVIDCGDHGHLDMEMLKMIPAGSKLYTHPQPAAQDAERYRWLRDFHADVIHDELPHIAAGGNYVGAWALSGEDADKAIDAAIAAQQGGSK